jgi:hypothetical protein
MVRDTTDRDGGALGFTATAWREFLGALKSVLTVFQSGAGTHLRAPALFACSAVTFR